MNAPGTVSLFSGYSPHVPGWRVHQDNSRFLLMLAGRRGGKTLCGAKEFCRRVFNDLRRSLAAREPYDPGVEPTSKLWWKRRARLHYWVIAEVFDLLEEAQRYLLQTLPPDLIERADNQQNQWWLVGDILIEFKSARDPERLVSTGLNGAWITEAARVPAAAWPNLRPALADKQGWCIADTTPLGQDWTYDVFDREADRGTPGYSVHRWSTLENTRRPELQEEVKLARLTMPDAYFRREFEASREAFFGQIYESFDESKHGADALPPNLQFARQLGGQDWGFSAPGAQLIAGITYGPPEMAHVWFVDEVYDNSRLVEEFWVPWARAMMAKWRFGQFVADPAEPDNLFRFRDAGVQCVGHKNYGSGKFDEHSRSVRAGIRTMACIIKAGRFHVLRGPGQGKGGCPNLIAELKSYRWRDRPGSVPTAANPLNGLIEEPAPGQKDHAVTAARYVVSYALRGPALSPLNIAA